MYVGGPARFEHPGLLPAHELEEHPKKAVRQIRRLARDWACHGCADGVVRAEELGVAVDDVEGGL